MEQHIKEAVIESIRIGRTTAHILSASSIQRDSGQVRVWDDGIEGHSMSFTGHMRRKSADIHDQLVLIEC